MMLELIIQLIFIKKLKILLPSYEIIPEKCGEIFPQIIGCFEDLVSKLFQNCQFYFKTFFNFKFRLFKLSNF